MWDEETASTTTTTKEIITVTGIRTRSQRALLTATTTSTTRNLSPVKATKAKTRTTRRPALQSINNNLLPQQTQSRNVDFAFTFTTPIKEKQQPLAKISMPKAATQKKKVGKATKEKGKQATLNFGQGSLKTKRPFSPTDEAEGSQPPAKRARTASVESLPRSSAFTVFESESQNAEMASVTEPGTLTQSNGDASNSHQDVGAQPKLQPRLSPPPPYSNVPHTPASKPESSNPITSSVARLKQAEGLRSSPWKDKVSKVIRPGLTLNRKPAPPNFTFKVNTTISIDSNSSNGPSIVHSQEVTIQHPGDTTAESANTSASTSQSQLPRINPVPPTPSRLPRPAVSHLSAAFNLPTALSPIKSPSKAATSNVTASAEVPSSTAKPARTSILRRAGTVPGPSSLFGNDGGTPLSGTLAALLNRRTVDPHEGTRAQISNLNDALGKIAAPRPQQQRPASSLGLSTPVSGTGTGAFRGIGGAIRKPGVMTGPNRPGTSLGHSLSRTAPGGPVRPGMNPAARVVRNPALAGKGGPSNMGMGPPPLSSTSRNAIANAGRRASMASFALSQSLPPSQGKTVTPPKPYTTASGRRVISTSARAAPLRTPTEEPEQDTSMTTPENEKTAPVASQPLDVLKDCVIFVDVRTDDGEDAGGLFVDMLKGLGARLLARPGKTLTHIIYKSGLQSTLTQFRALPDPKPLVVGIGWVVDCVEKREKVDTKRFEISLEEVAGSVSGLKESKAGKKQVQTKLSFGKDPKRARTRGNEDDGDVVMEECGSGDVEMAEPRLNVENEKST